MLRVRINWTGNAEGFSVLHFEGDLDGGTNGDAAATAVDGFLGNLENYMGQFQFAQVDPEVLQVNDVTGQTEAVHTVVKENHQGTGDAAQVPQSTMLLIRWRTGAYTNGREIRGRTFIPGLEASANDGSGAPTAAVITGIGALATTLAAATPSLVVYSPTRSAIATVASASVWSEWAVMRSRRE